MALLHPDTSDIPIWRRRPTKVEHPITAWRAWGLRIAFDSSHFRYSDNFTVVAHLRSVAAACEWEGPVLRAHKRPVDPQYWDAYRADEDPEHRYIAMQETFEIAGVWAVKTQEQAKGVADDYHVPVYGRIKMWGRVAQFERGYRAEACMIEELWLTRYFFLARRDGWDLRGPYTNMMVSKIQAALENRYQCKVNVE